MNLLNLPRPLPADGRVQEAALAEVLPVGECGGSVDVLAPPRGPGVFRSTRINRNLRVERLDPRLLLLADEVTSLDLFVPAQREGPSGKLLLLRYW
jgi:hypothetical protein